MSQHHAPPTGYPGRQPSYGVPAPPPVGQPPLTNASSYGAPPPPYHPPPQYYQQQQPGPPPLPYPASPYQATAPYQQVSAPLSAYSQGPPLVYEQAAPVLNQAPPVYNQAPPPYGQAPPPAYDQLPPYSGAVPTSYSQGPPPTYGQGAPVYSQALPVYNQAPPAYGQAPPPAYDHLPPYSSAPPSSYPPAPMYTNNSPPAPQQQQSQGPYPGAPPPNTAPYGYTPSPAPAPYIGNPIQYAPNYGNDSLVQSGSSFSNASAPPPGPVLALDRQGIPLIAGDDIRSPCKLRIEEKVFDATRDSFTVTDNRKRALYTVDGSRTADQYKVLKNAHGQALLQMRQRSSLKTKMLISDMQGTPLLCLIRARTDGKDHKRIDGYLGADASGSTSLLVVGNGSCSSFKIENAHEVVIADVTRSARSAKKFFTGQDSYQVDCATCSPALITMIVVAIDEMYCDADS